MLNVSDQATRRRFLRWGAGSGAVVSAAALFGASQPRAAHAQGTDPVVGSWYVAVTGGTDPNEHDLVSFYADGNVLASNPPYTPADPSDPMSTASYTSTGQGTWSQLNGQYRAAFVSIDTDATGAFMDASKVSISFTVAADGMSASGTYGIEVRDASGAVLFASPPDFGSFQATRITL
jgi:hypothetical protein